MTGGGVETAATAPPAAMDRRGADDIVLRPARDDDAAGLIALIAGCFAEYPGCILDVDGEMPYLRRIAGAFAEVDGEFWVAEHRRRLVGSVGLRPRRQGTIALVNLYVARSARRRGLGARLTGLVEDGARRRRADVVDLWSDTRFRDAHRLYERLGYRRMPETRHLSDLSSSVEFRFIKAVEASP